MLLTPEQRLPARLERIAPRFAPGRFVWVSVGATLTVLGGLSWGAREFLRIPAEAVLPHFRPPVSGDWSIGECELAAAVLAIMARCADGDRNVALRTDNQNVLSWAEHARSHSPLSN